MNPDPELSRAVDDVLTDILSDNLVRRLEAKALRSVIERDILGAAGNASLGDAGAMAQWWALRLAFDPMLKVLRIIEAGRVSADVERAWKVVEDFERETGIPAQLAVTLIEQNSLER
jgi:hypothetical protein